MTCSLIFVAIRDDNELGDSVTMVQPKVVICQVLVAGLVPKQFTTPRFMPHHDL